MYKPMNQTLMSYTIVSLRVVRSSLRFKKPPTYRKLASMATGHTIHITPDNTGLWKVPQDESAAKKASELLQQDLEKHHVYFNDRGFHDHITHHILSLYGTGASPEQLQKAYDVNASYQRPPGGLHEEVLKELKNWEAAKKWLGKGEYYTDFLAFFQNEVDKLGWEKTLNEYLFKGDEKSEDMLVRMFAGLVHPLIQLMYGIEWKQPAIVAMALAQTAVHQNYFTKFLHTAEEAAKSNPTPMPSIASLLEDVATNKKLATASKLDDYTSKIRGVLAKAWDETIEITSRVKVKPEGLDERTAEMYHTTIYEAASAAFHPGKVPKFDFFLMHHVNISPIFITINNQDWISTEVKVRLLEWKIRLDLIQYAARNCPPLRFDELTSYVPKDKKYVPKEELLRRVQDIENDDGHAIKLFRAVSLGQTVSEKYEDKDWVKIKGDLWTKLNHLIVDSLEAPGPHWVRGAGDPKAWDEIPDLPKDVNGVSDKLEQVHL
ncbi:hypothetical protein F5Y06DRAFT_279493 [Hypoxylon sp. FL0890]|nr:hypothetical protein F5Y06DRAFT_279493 [Hypoxylon sp. FL0890]